MLKMEDVTMRRTTLPHPPAALLLLAFVAIAPACAQGQNRQDPGKPPATRELRLDQRYLHFPVGLDKDRSMVKLLVDGEIVRYFTLEIAPKGATPLYWASLDVGEFAGKQATLAIEGEAKLLDAVEQGATIRTAQNAYRESHRPQFHFSPRVGWTNDPNGLVYLDGEYHLFFQHNPYGTNWGNMTWGHAVSTDLVHWEELGDALHPDISGTMFSGSAVADHQNTSGLQRGDAPPMLAFYTAAGGQSYEKRPFTQCMAYSTDRGRTWIKYAGNPVVAHIRGGNRDPKVFWHAPSNKWIMVLYIDRGNFVVFASKNLRDWEKQSGLKFPEGHECPELFELPLDGDPAKTRWVIWEGGGRHMIGGFDGTTFTPETGVLKSEWGVNCYAGQLWNHVPDGRTLFIGWMRAKTLPGAKFPVYPGMPFNQQMTFPREFTLRGTAEGPRLFAMPAREIETLRRAHYTWSAAPLEPGVNLLQGVSGELFDIEATIAPQTAQRIVLDVRGTPITYNTQTRILACMGKEAETGLHDGRLKLRVLVDRTSLEIFVNDGRHVFSFCFAPDANNKTLRLAAEGGTAAVHALNVWKLASIWAG